MSNWVTIMAVDPGASGGSAISSFHSKMGMGTINLVTTTTADSFNTVVEMHKPDLVVLEDVTGKIGNGSDEGRSSSAFAFGVHFGLVQGICMAHGAKVSTISPIVWQRRLGLRRNETDITTKAGWKRHLAEEAKRLVGNKLARHSAPVTLKTADAALILLAWAKGNLTTS